MNDLKSKWNELKSKVRMKWNKLTDADVSCIDGRCDRLTSSVQSRYGCSQDEATRQVDQFCQENRIEKDQPVNRSGEKTTDASMQAQGTSSGSQSAPGAQRGTGNVSEGNSASGNLGSTRSAPTRDRGQGERQGEAGQ